MRKSLAPFLILFLTLTISYAQKNNGNNSNKETGRTNLILPHGNMGLNTLTPTERLEVIGNVRVSQSIFAHDLDVIGLSTTNITIRQDASIGRNLFINGNVGIGISNPTERLHINGNLRVNNTIFTDLLEFNVLTGNNGTFNENLSVLQNFTVNGLTGLGIANPSERLEVAGNVRATQALLSATLQSGSGSFSNNLDISNQLTVGGNVGLGVVNPSERLDINGNVRVSNAIYSDVLDFNALLGNTGTFRENLSVQQNLSVSGLVGIGVANPIEKLDVDGNIKSTRALISSTLQTGVGNFSGKVNVADQFTVDGNVGLGVSSPTERLDISGNLKVSNTVYAQDIQSTSFSTDNINVENQLSVGGNTTIAGNLGLGTINPSEKLDVVGNVKVSGSINGDNSTFNNSVVNSELTVNGTSDFTGEITANNIKVLGVLDLKNGLSLGGSLGIGIAAPSEGLHVAGNGVFDGNLTATKLIVQELEVANLDLGSQNGGSINFDDDMIVGGSVGIGTDRIEGYSLSVNGKIRAADDIKVYPSSQWADYVFESDYKLQTLDEVQNFIDENGHLPNMPSSKEVEEEGIDLGSMDAKLLEKIEELTLYMLELKKENEELKKDIQSIKATQSNK